MTQEMQKTIKRDARFSGIALHTGARATMTIKPSAEDTGVVFRRVDLPGSPEVRADVRNVAATNRGTTICAGKAAVHTVEHVLAAMHALGVDNALVEMDGPEPPVGDGSALPYIGMLNDAGLQEQSAPAKYWTASAPIVVEDRDTKLVLTPCDSLKITCIVAFGATPLDAQYLSQVITPEFFVSDIAPARTFCLYKELEQLLAMGLIKGGSLDNSAVIHNGAIICKEGLRFPTELVRHKILDIVGDIYLTGRRVKAHIIAVKPGHGANVRLAGEMIKQG